MESGHRGEGGEQWGEQWGGSKGKRRTVPHLCQEEKARRVLSRASRKVDPAVGTEQLSDL